MTLRARAFGAAGLRGGGASHIEVLSAGMLVLRAFSLVGRPAPVVLDLSAVLDDERVVAGLDHEVLSASMRSAELAAILSASALVTDFESRPVYAQLAPVNLAITWEFHGDDE